MIFASHSSDSSKKLNIHLTNALEAGRSTGNIFVIKYELIQQELLTYHIILHKYISSNHI